MSVQAWFRRGKANASLGHHHDAIQDLSISLKLELSSSGKRLIENEMKMIVSQYKETSCLMQKSEQCALEICGMTLSVTHLSYHISVPITNY